MNVITTTTRPNPIKSLLHSRKFLLLLLDVIISITIYFVSKYAAPSAIEDVKFLIGALQPIFIALIASIAYEDGQTNPAAIINQIASNNQPPYDDSPVG